MRRGATGTGGETNVRLHPHPQRGYWIQEAGVMTRERAEQIAWAEYLRGYLRQAKRLGFIKEARAALRERRA